VYLVAIWEISAHCDLFPWSNFVLQVFEFGAKALKAFGQAKDEEVS
jgi:hypothetical protein